ncbi:hypothetical protein ABIB82_007585 [Bradyrhizobium sp. i1.8.4]
MMTSLIFAAAAILLLALCVPMAYRMGFREGREQGFSESFKLYGGIRRTPDNAWSSKQEHDSSVA